LGGPTLSKSIFEIKGEFNRGERIYAVKPQELLRRIRSDKIYLKSFIKQMAETLLLLSDL